MKVLKALFVALSIVALATSCGFEEEIILPEMDSISEGGLGDRDDGETPPEL